MEKHLHTCSNMLRLFLNVRNICVTKKNFYPQQHLLRMALLSMVFFAIKFNNAEAATKATNTAGNWGTGANWTTTGVPASGDDATVNHATTINTNLTISTGGTYVINAPTIDAAGGTAYTMSIGGSIFGTATLEVKSAMTIEGALTVSDFGRVYVRNGAVLTVGAATFAALSTIVVDEGGTLIVNGNLLVYGNAPQINGDLIINGSYIGDALSAIYGTGTMTTTGTATTILTGTVFGNLNDCGGTCTYTTCASSATISPSSPSVCAGSSATLTGSFSPTTIGTITYQWQSSTTAVGGYSNISGATLASYSAGAASSTYYRVRITQFGCTATSSAVLLTVVPIPTVTSTTPTSICGPGSITLGATASAGTIHWFTGSVGGTNIGTGNSYSPSVSGTTTYYAAAVNGTCVSISRTAVIATVNTIPTITSTTPASRCGPGSVTLSAAASAGTISWFSLSSGGSPIATGTSYSPSITGNTTYYVEAMSLGCTTTSRTSVTAALTPCAVIWSGGTSTDWGTASNWNPAFVPASINNVTIPSGTTYQPSVTSSGAAAAITINPGATLSMASTGVLNAYGNITNNGTINPVAGSTLVFAGSTAQTITGVAALYNVTVKNAAGVSLLSVLTVNGTITLTNGVLTTGSNLAINFDNGGNIAYNVSDGGSISGNVTGRRAGLIRAHYIAAPFAGVTSAQVQATTPLYYNNYWKLYSRDFTTQGWLAVTNTTTAMPLGSAFSLTYPSTSTLVLTGTYSHSTSFTTPSYSNAVAGKFIIIGNPYPSTIDWTASGWTKTNVGNAIYFWNASTNSSSSYASGIGTGNPTGTPYVGAMQAFLVATVGTTGTSSVSIANGVRLSTPNAPFLRTASEEIIRIKLQSENAEQWDDAVVRFNENATTDFDPDFDAYKIINQGFMPSVYTTLGDTKYSINSIADAGSLETIPVAVKLPADGNYTLSISKSNPAIDYILIDKKLGTENLISDPTYVFSGLTTDDVNRFELKLRTTLTMLTTGTQTANASAALQISSSIKGFVIQSKQYSGSVASIEIMDVTGKLITIIADKSLSEVTYMPLDLAEGAYLIKVNVGDTEFIQMITLTK